MLKSSAILSFGLMIYLKHAGIALATSIVAWLGTIIYMTLLIKNGKIVKLTFSFKEEENLLSVIFYISTDYKMYDLKANQKNYSQNIPSNIKNSW